MSPDWSAKVEPVPYAKLDDPQSLNLYGYMLDSPLDGVDQDGHYVCADGAKCSSANDKAFQARLNDLKLAQSRLKSGSKAYNRIGKVLAYYGGAGKTKTANGKTVSVSFRGGPGTGGRTKRVGGEISVNFASNFSQVSTNNRLGMTVLVGHEGQHVVDGAPVGTARFRSEFNAERTSQMILDGLSGTKINPYATFTVRGSTLWQDNGGPLGITDDAGLAFVVAVKDYRYDVEHY